VHLGKFAGLGRFYQGALAAALGTG